MGYYNLLMFPLIKPFGQIFPLVFFYDQNMKFYINLAFINLNKKNGNDKKNLDIIITRIDKSLSKLIMLRWRF